MSGLLIVSNRLPVTVQAGPDGVTVTRSTGGLATALSGPHGRLDSRWIGWPGDVSRLSAEERVSVEGELERAGTVPVHLSATEVERYYDGFSNGVLWPLFHYLLDKVNLDARLDWEAYKAVNARFADAVVEHYRSGDLIWVHDYQLMLVPALVRRRLPQAKIGFFLHTPFPAAEVFRLLPWREQLLRGLLGADRIGFHTSSYRHHFVQAAARMRDRGRDEDGIELEGRRIELGVHPIGVDAQDLARLARDPEVRAEAQRIRDEAHGRKIVLGIDRLDYTKGIPRRLVAIDRLLEREPDLRDRVRFIQLAVPTREKVGGYADFRTLVHELVGRINGQYGGADAVPIHFLHQSLAIEQVVALYLAADVMLVTPLRDGMNLVAKEYAATRVDDTGVLVLSEFAGAAAELLEALHVNPYDIESVANAVKRALDMPATEQRLRMRALRGRVAAHDVHGWAQTFLDELGQAPGVTVEAEAALREPPEELVLRAQRAPSLVLILDYDGTLVPIAPLPALASPDDDVLALLGRLAAHPRIQLHVVSGRRRVDLEGWLGALPIGLHAEHGFWSRPVGTTAWTALEPADVAWKATMRPILDEATRRTAGSFVEEKTASLAWHYRAAEPELSRRRVDALRTEHVDLLREHHLDLLLGSKVIEVRPQRVHKGRVVPTILAAAPKGAAIVAIGDDRTDEDIFAAAPTSALTIHVGVESSSARYRLADPAAVRRLLRRLMGPLILPDLPARRISSRCS
jgi:trehalose 6-phosphate synthase/phosphatase